jgi:hypothetical protein
VRCFSGSGAVWKHHVPRQLTDACVRLPPADANDVRFQNRKRQTVKAAVTFSGTTQYRGRGVPVFPTGSLRSSMRPSNTANLIPSCSTLACCSSCFASQANSLAAVSFMFLLTMVHRILNAAVNWQGDDGGSALMKTAFAGEHTIVQLLRRVSCNEAQQRP